MNLIKKIKHCIKYKKNVKINIWMTLEKIKIHVYKICDRFVFC